MSTVKSYFLRDGKLIEDEREWRTHEAKAMTRRFKRMPCFQVWTDGRTSRYGHYSHLGWQSRPKGTMPKKLRMYLLLMGVRV